MIDSYWQWMASLMLGMALILIPVIGWRLYLRTLPTPDVATEAKAGRLGGAKSRKRGPNKLHKRRDVA